MKTDKNPRGSLYQIFIRIRVRGNFDRLILLNDIPETLQERATGTAALIMLRVQNRLRFFF